MTKRALVPLEGGEHNAALAWLVIVMEQEAGHGGSLSERVLGDIGRAP